MAAWKEKVGWVEGGSGEKKEKKVGMRAWGDDDAPEVSPESLEEENPDAALPLGLQLGARLDIRYAVENDVKARGKASDSNWYKVNGRNAGKESQLGERAPLLTDRRKYGRYAEGAEEEYVGEARRQRRRSRSPGRRNGGEGGRRGGPTADDLDKELEMMRNGEEPPARTYPDRERGGRRDGERNGFGDRERRDGGGRGGYGGRRENHGRREERGRGGGRGGGAGRGGERKPRTNQEDLDAGELSDTYACLVWSMLILVICDFTRIDRIPSTTMKSTIYFPTLPPNKNYNLLILAVSDLYAHHP